jgi:hypothetical protein
MKLTSFAQTMRVLLGLIVGLPMGVILGLWIPYYIAVLLGPAFVQVGWIFLMVTVPGGGILGGYLGGCTIENRPRLFVGIVLPLAILVVGGTVAHSALRAYDRPRTFVLNVADT